MHASDGFAEVGLIDKEPYIVIAQADGDAFIEDDRAEENAGGQ